MRAFSRSRRVLTAAGGVFLILCGVTVFWRLMAVASFSTAPPDALEIGLFYVALIAAIAAMFFGFIIAVFAAVYRGVGV